MPDGRERRSDTWLIRPSSVEKAHNPLLSTSGGGLLVEGGGGGRLPARTTQVLSQEGSGTDSRRAYLRISALGGDSSFHQEVSGLILMGWIPLVSP